MKKIITAVILLGIIALYGCTNKNQETSPSTESSLSTGVNKTDISINAGDRKYYVNGSGKEYTGYYSAPSTGTNLPALILIHEWWGLNDNIKMLAESFSKQGYVVLAVNMYGLPATTDQNEAMKRASEVRTDLTGGFANLSSAINYLKGLPQVDGNRIGSVGWCFGGGWAYEVAKNNIGSKVSVMYYGRFSEHDDLTHMRSEILGHFGENDASISIDTVKEFQAKLKTLSGDHAVYIYPNAGHSFANSGEAYNEEAANLAWNRTLDFLNKNLR